MPTYEYACSTCQHEWEFEQSIKDDPLTECPSCHQSTARRQISRGTGFILKGGGWYSDLYSSSSNKPTSGDAKGSDDGSKGSGDGSKASGGESKASGDKSTTGDGGASSKASSGAATSPAAAA